MKPTFFAAPPELRGWLEKHHESSQELMVGFYKKGSGIPSITWPEAVDQALCFGWIDGRSKRIDDVSYFIRFTPRRPTSIWSSINIARVKELTRLGLMEPAGLRAFAKRTKKKSEIYSYEQKDEIKLDEAFERQFRANKKAWSFFQSQAAWYQRTAMWRVMSAKKEETRLKRLGQLIESSEAGRTIPQLTRPRGSK
ncbi:MAG: YdeI/OmpD-associated family protein [Actinobacteria bacterium]|nr:YdeI/OmpD-associated family protein [Actinomycetota bacterium]